MFRVCRPSLRVPSVELDLFESDGIDVMTTYSLEVDL